MNEPKYIGDGVYAQFDGYYIWIYTNNGERKSERIALEPQTFSGLNKFCSECWNPKLSGNE